MHPWVKAYNDLADRNFQRRYQSGCVDYMQATMPDALNNDILWPEHYREHLFNLFNENQTMGIVEAADYKKMINIDFYEYIEELKSSYSLDDIKSGYRHSFSVTMLLATNARELAKQEQKQLSDCFYNVHQQTNNATDDPLADFTNSLVGIACDGNEHALWHLRGNIDFDSEKFQLKPVPTQILNRVNSVNLVIS